MDIKYFKEEKTTKKTNPKEPVMITNQGFVDADGTVLSFYDFFKSFEGKYVVVTVVESSKEDLEEEDDKDGS